MKLAIIMEFLTMRNIGRREKCILLSENPNEKLSYNLPRNSDEIMLAIRLLPYDVLLSEYTDTE